ncbi:MAG: sigma-E factor negative regulatory protein RseB [Cellvibrionaceae bacterium]|jgi:sigma-E factor negative regulatory protein RseB
MHLLLIIAILLCSMPSLGARELASQSPVTLPSSNIREPSVAVITDNDSSSSSQADSKKLSVSNHIVIDSLSSLFKVISTANKIVNYHSLMTYEANGFITTYRLLHKVKDNVAQEQLIFMDGPRRQVIRKQKLNACLSGDTRWGLWPTVLSESLLSAYTLNAQRVERIADREAIVFGILPKDSLRYAYEYSIDKETGLLLRVVTYHKKVIIERLQTVAIEFSSPESQLEFTGASDYLWRVPEAEPCYTEQFEPAWRADWLPEGFISVGNRITAQGEQVLIFADGLVSISVFIIKRNAKNLQRATARHGATVVVITPESSKSNKTIAVVGEIPTATAIRIAAFIKPI